MTVQTGPDRGTVLRSGLKIWDRTADKSVQSGPVPVPRSGPVSLPRSWVATTNSAALSVSLGMLRTFPKVLYLGPRRSHLISGTSCSRVGRVRLIGAYTYIYSSGC